MRLHRFIGDFDLSGRRLEVRDAPLANQLGNVFRLGEGDEVLLCDGKGRESLARIESLGKAEVAFLIASVTEVTTEPQVAVTLYCAMLKRENFELAAQKAVEAGVVRIVPLRTRRTVKQDIRADRLAKIAREAAEQSGRGTVPAIAAPMTLDAALQEATECDSRLFFDLGGRDARELFADQGGSVALFIGPEGGWEPEETTAATKAGCAIASLGPRTLRAETAAIVATWLAAAE